MGQLMTRCVYGPGVDIPINSQLYNDRHPPIDDSVHDDDDDSSSSGCSTCSSPASPRSDLSDCYTAYRRRH